MSTKKYKNKKVDMCQILIWNDDDFAANTLPYTWEMNPLQIPFTKFY